jgi:hypothetical protein
MDTATPARQGQAKTMPCTSAQQPDRDMQCRQLVNEYIISELICWCGVLVTGKGCGDEKAMKQAVQQYKYK